MARFGMLYRNAHVEFPPSIGEAKPSKLGKLTHPSASTWVGIFGFLCYGAAVITAANLLALQIQ